MSIEQTGPVSLAETQAIVAQLRELTARAEDNGQQLFHFVLSMAADSLSDNLETAAEIEIDAAD